jgi:ABC-type dipeptide/oligopeptide/nickel transport system ATPase component
MEPQLLIADEAVSALDVSVQAQVLRLLDEVRERFDLAILFITHDLRVAAQICDRIAVMQNGVVVEEGRTAEIFAAPTHSYTQALFAAAPGRGVVFGGAGATVAPPSAAGSSPHQTSPAAATPQPSPSAKPGTIGPPAVVLPPVRRLPGS